MSAEVFRFTNNKKKEINTKYKENTTKNQLEANINSHSLCSFKNARDKTKQLKTKTRKKYKNKKKMKKEKRASSECATKG